ncbi:MAG: hypothetical protein U5N86_12420 [Planctomycetota bacterium]|nr:hypothetical protein [Planctomycetota bacterium]
MVDSALTPAMAKETRAIDEETGEKSSKGSNRFLYIGIGFFLAIALLIIVGILGSDRDPSDTTDARFGTPEIVLDESGNEIVGNPICQFIVADRSEPLLGRLIKIDRDGVVTYLPRTGILSRFSRTYRRSKCFRVRSVRS